MKQKFISSLILFIFTLMCIGAYMLVRESKLSMVSSIGYAESNKKASPSKPTKKEEKPKEDTSKEDNSQEEDKKDENNNTVSSDITNDVLTPDPSISGKVETPYVPVIKDEPLEVVPEPELPKEEPVIPITPEIKKISLTTDEEKTINLDGYDEVNVNITSNNLITLKANSKIDKVVIDSNATLKLDMPVTNLTIKNSDANLIINNNVDNLYAEGYDAKINGQGTINNLVAKAEGLNSSIKPSKVSSDNIADLIIYADEDIALNPINIINTSKISFSFTNSLNGNINLDDLTLYDSNGKKQEIYNLSKEGSTYYLVTNLLTEQTYELYVNLPSNITISNTFTYINDNLLYSNISFIKNEDNAILQINGLNMDKDIYYYVQSANASSWNKCEDSSCVIEKGQSAKAIKGNNNIEIADVNDGDILLLVIDDTLYDPITLQSSFNIVSANEIAKNTFAFTLDSAPLNDLELKDIKLTSSNLNNLTLEDAKIYISSDKLTYKIVVKDNYSHGINNYLLSINDTLTKDFTSNFDSIIISKDKVVRLEDNLVSFTFEASENGMIYFGRFEDTKSVYAGINSTPIAAKVVKNVLNGSNKLGFLTIYSKEVTKGTNEVTIDITGYDVTGETKVWALFVDSDGNYEKGYVNSFGPVPEVGFDFANPYGSNLKITNINTESNPLLTLSFNEEFATYAETKVTIKAISGEEARTLKRYSYTLEKEDLDLILKLNEDDYYFPKGTYNIEINLYDKDNHWVKVKEEFTIS